LAVIEHAVTHVEKQIQELVDKELEVFKALYLRDREIKYVILTGDYIVELMRQIDKNKSLTVKADRFIHYLNELNCKNIEEIADELNLSNDKDPLIVPAIVLYKRVVQELNAQEIYVPGVNINDGIAYDYAQKNNILKANHDFEEDVLSAAKNMADRYWGYKTHINALTDMSVLIFDAMKKIHGMGKRERLLLKTAAILHDCGKYVSMVNSTWCSYEIIMASELMGLSHLEREIVARVVLYNSLPLDSYDEVADKLDKQSYLIVAKLAAILKVSNAMDRSHKQKFKNVKAGISGKELVITIETADDIILEKGLFDSKSAFFEEIYSIKPVIKEKRVYS
jgi:exopolyphosphatase/guanosine-5'-triphosphate,3'-diphosphate pyrophosphatase